MKQPTGHLPLAHRLADAAARETVPRFRTALIADDKDGGSGVADFDPVTEADREAERAMRAVVAQAAPGHGVLGEEFSETLGDSPYRWVLDPVDGTRAFVCGVPVWTTLIGLERDGVSILGVIDQPVSRERWWGGEDVPAMLRRGGEEVPARTSGCETLDTARLMVTDLRHAPGGYLSADQVARIGAVSAQCRLTRQGLDSYAFGLVASGHMDLVIEAGLGWHDIAAVVPVIEAAGGTATDWSGARPRQGWDGTAVIAASPALAEAARAVLSAG